MNPGTSLSRRRSFRDLERDRREREKERLERAPSPGLTGFLAQASSLARRGSRRLSQVFVKKSPAPGASAGGGPDYLTPEEEIKFIDTNSDADSEFEFRGEAGLLDDDDSDHGGFLGTQMMTMGLESVCCSTSPAAILACPSASLGFF